MTKHLMTINRCRNHLGVTKWKIQCVPHANVVAYITFQRNGNPNDFSLYVGSVFASLNAIQIGL